jgi:nitrogen-specific signal transduction histidine kinase
MERLAVTHFASPDRAPHGSIDKQHREFVVNPIFRRLLDCFPEPAMVLNANRQIVYSNDKLTAMLGRKPEFLLGLRPGEAIGCVHADEGACGCGTTRFCRLCGAAQAIVHSQDRQACETEECRITCRRAEGRTAQDLRVWASPIEIEDAMLTVFALRDTTDEKRREVLERVFYHDLLNTAGGLRGILEMWPEVGGEEAVALSEHARDLSELVIDEIESHRDLVEAERGNLGIDVRAIDVAPLVERLCLLHGRLTQPRGVVIEPPEFSGPTVVRTDETLLSRILGNLLKNAIEASKTGQKVRVRFVNPGSPTFHVYNDAFMPEDVQLQVFQRSFSTKDGKGRGVGTYSVKLLTERYLRGWVEFHSSPLAGTVFSVTLPG